MGGVVAAPPPPATDRPTLYCRARLPSPQTATGRYLTRTWRMDSTATPHTFAWHRCWRRGRQTGGRCPLHAATVASRSRRRLNGRAGISELPILAGPPACCALFAALPVANTARLFYLGAPCAAPPGKHLPLWIIEPRLDSTSGSERAAPLPTKRFYSDSFCLPTSLLLIQQRSSHPTKRRFVGIAARRCSPPRVFNPLLLRSIVGSYTRGINLLL